MLFGLFNKNKREVKSTEQSMPVAVEVSDRKGLKLNTSELRVGMFVSELDRPWLMTPFKLQGFWIRNQEDIDEIARHCNYVFIDVTESSRWRTNENSGNLESIDRKSHRLPTKENWFSEQVVYKRVNSLTFELLDDIALGGPGISKSAKKIVASCIQRILDNPHTMILVAQMAKKGKALESHAMSCCVLASAFGRYLGIEDSQLHKLALGALLHDVGMLKVDCFVKGPVNNVDKERYREHVIIGRDLLMANAEFWPAVDVAYSHHERIDGRGYPRGLKGERIPYFARIVSIVEAYDSMVSNHTYKSSIISPTEAMAELYRNRGKQFDRGLVESFIRYMGLYPLGSLVQLTTGEIGIVVEKNPFYKRMPKVVLVLDKKGNRIRSDVVDLFHEQNRDGSSRYMIQRTLPNGSHGVYSEKYLEEGIIEAEPDDK
ncbi:MAG: HD domain-containing phosphohydrolase [Candidatus Sedimenticola sp. 20ELBAFRAG]